MKITNLVLVLMIAIFNIHYVSSQNNGIAKSLGLYIFPSNDQDAATQNTDEAACYSWAIEQSGYDPLNPTKVEAAPVDTGPDGSAVKGAAVGAAGGAAIGAIAGDAGKGAAIGAIVGGVRGRRASKQADASQAKNNEQAATNYNAALLADYKKAFSVCMEGKGYTIK
jgi:hypothetical protein